ncbi:MAG: HEPN domain-containing protein [Sulfolobales archaeon]
MLEDRGLRAQAERVMDFVRWNRRILAELEDAHTRAVYGSFQYSRDQAQALLEAARKVVEVVEGLEKEIFGG